MFFWIFKYKNQKNGLEINKLFDYDFKKNRPNFLRFSLPSLSFSLEKYSIRPYKITSFNFIKDYISLFITLMYSCIPISLFFMISISTSILFVFSSGTKGAPNPPSMSLSLKKI